VHRHAIVLSPEMLQNPLPGAIGAPVWMGDMLTYAGLVATPHTLAVGPNGVGAGCHGWTKRLDPRRAAAERGDGLPQHLVIGYGGRARRSGRSI
jgi:hypothetical protein